MSAVIAIMNKHGVALAADSAVTISGGEEKKIYQNANKIFTLSKYNPVGVMVYSSATFMDTPWEVILKVYREQLNDKSFKTVESYCQDFIEFLKSKSFYSQEEEQRETHKRKIFQLIIELNKEAFRDKEALVEDPTTNKEVLNKCIIDIVEVFTEKTLSNFQKCPEFEDYTKEDYLRYSADLINEVKKNCLQ